MKGLPVFLLMGLFVCGCTTIGLHRDAPVAIIFEEGFDAHVVSMRIKHPEISSTFQLTTDDSTALAGHLDFRTSESAIGLTLQTLDQGKSLEETFIVDLTKGRYVGIDKTKTGFAIHQYVDEPVYD